jgi:hypothetical protein
MDVIDQQLAQVQAHVDQLPALCGAVIDQSGSMDLLRQETITGFNQFLEGQRAHPGTLLVHLTLFDTTVNARPAQLVADVADLDQQTYRPRGFTALYDAIGTTVANLEQAQKDTGATVVMLCIVTDGKNNASKEYSLHQVQQMIKDKQDAGWEVLWLGAGPDAMTEAGNLGVSRNTTASYAATGAGAQSVYTTLSTHTNTLRSTGKKSHLTDEERRALQGDDS